jgi:hypothetical protein
MAEEDPVPGERSRTFVWMMGTAALLAWLSLLWFMFSDVL